MAARFLERALNLTDAGIERIYREFGLLVVDHEWWTEPQRIFSRAEQEQPFVECQLDDAVPQFGRALPGILVAHEFNSDHQARSANLADNFVPLAPVRCETQDQGPHASRVGHVTPLEEANRSERRGDGDRITPKG